MLKEVPYTIFLHNEEQRTEYLKNPTIDPASLVVTNVPYGIAKQRQWIQDNFLNPDEWYITMDDNIDHITGVEPSQYHHEKLPVKDPSFDKKIFTWEYPLATFLMLFEEDRTYAESIGAFNIGYATTPNFFFREKKYRTVGYVISKLAIRKNCSIPFDKNVLAMDDFQYTAECLLRHGKVLINNYILPVAGHYQKGGIGTIIEREQMKIADGQYLMLKYPGLFRFNRKSGMHPMADLSIRFTKEKQVTEWLQNMSKITL